VPTVSVSGGRGDLAGKSQRANPLSGQNPLGRGQRPPPVRLHAMLAGFAPRNPAEAGCTFDEVFNLLKTALPDFCRKLRQIQ